VRARLQTRTEELLVTELISKGGLCLFVTHYLFLKKPPADLTTLARRHGGKFPYDYVTNVLQFGSGPSVHGSSDMPAWGPIFRYLNKNDERAVQKRIKNLCDYLATVQQN
jgi:hypothetical protein